MLDAEVSTKARMPGRSDVPGRVDAGHRGAQVLVGQDGAVSRFEATTGCELDAWCCADPDDHEIRRDALSVAEANSGRSRVALDR